jgi:hypothetical protein
MAAKGFQDAPCLAADDLLASFLGSVRRHQHERGPFDHWILEDALPAEACEAILALPFEPNQARFDGRREANNSTRVYFAPPMQARFPICAAIADLFQSQPARSAIAALTKVDLNQGRLRIEYCQDIDGFWLEPHVDIPVKLVTMLIYLSDDPALSDAGTDIYGPGPEHRRAGRVGYRRGRALIFAPDADTWHGFTPRPIRSVRKTLIVNYVSADWRSVAELA